MKIRKSRRKWLIVLSVLVAVVGVALLSAAMWYQQNYEIGRASCRERV